jgi:hypothetical protein
VPNFHAGAFGMISAIFADSACRILSDAAPGGVKRLDLFCDIFYI